jgi:hypothetical protein
MVTYEDENLSLINENTEGKIKSGKSRETGNIGYNRRRQTKQKLFQKRVVRTELDIYVFIVFII